MDSRLVICLVPIQMHVGHIYMSMLVVCVFVCLFICLPVVFFVLFF